MCLNVNFPPHFFYFPKTTAAAVCGLRKCFSSHTRYISRDNELDKHWTKLVIILPSSVTTTAQLLSLLQFISHKNNFSSPGLSVYFSTRGENGQLGGEGIKSPLSQWDLIQDVQSELSKTKRSSLSTQDWWVNFTDTWPFWYKGYQNFKYVGRNGYSVFCWWSCILKDTPDKLISPQNLIIE